MSKNRYEGRPSRLVVLPDERKIILGIDGAGVFKPGVVYSIEQWNGEIIFRELGEYALAPDGRNGDYPNECSETSAILQSGYHLFTKKEMDQYRESGQFKFQDEGVRDDDKEKIPED